MVDKGTEGGRIPTPGAGLRKPKTYIASNLFTGRSLSTLSLSVGNLRFRSAKAKHFFHTTCAC